MWRENFPLFLKCRIYFNTFLIFLSRPIYFEMKCHMLRMTPGMPVIKTFLVESFTTNIALHPPNSSVNRHVVVTIPCFCKSFRANFAMVSNSCVFIYMNAIICFIIISLFALFTIVRKFPSVSLHVCNDSGSRRILFIASRTFKLFWKWKLF